MPADLPLRGLDAQVWPVSRLLANARLLIEREMGLTWVAGEVSNLFRAASGHVYFVLKDPQAQVRCTLWRQKAQRLDFVLRDGLAVEVRALPSLYEAKGEFQLNVEAVRLAGLGALYERFAKLKAKLEAAGWFDPRRKRALPLFPKAVGVVTSPRGAALHDVLTTLRRRWPAARVVVYPAAVQGEGAAAEIVQAIASANLRGEVDVLIVCRGGGSIEDLWSFNEEPVARALLESRLPAVTGIGHETDFTICDFVADVRAPTPTGAATLVVPDAAECGARLAQWSSRLSRAGHHALAATTQRVDAAAARLTHPAARLAAQRERVRLLAERLARAGRRQSDVSVTALATLRGRLLREMRAPPSQKATLARCRDALLRAQRERSASLAGRLAALTQHLDHLNPRAVLARGYAIVASGDGSIVYRASEVAPGDEVALTFAEGEAAARITRSG